MASVFLSPIGNGFQWLNPAGLVLSGGKINTYFAGTTTPAATYTDNTGLVPNANPIILDSTGRYSQEIWLTGATYKLVITDSLGVIQFTLDNISGVGQSPSAIGYIYAEDYGAVGDGVTDDASAIKLAIAAASSRNIGIVGFRSIVYAIGSTLTIGNGSSSAYSTVNNVMLRGVPAPFERLNDSVPMSAVGTRFKWIGSVGGTMVQILGPSFGNAIQNIALNGNNTAANGLQILSNSRGYFPYITIDGFTGTGLSLSCVSAETIAGQTEGISSEGNIFDCPRVDGFDSGTSGTICINLDGYTGSASNGWDATRNTFRNTYLIVQQNNGTGIRLAFSDQNVFYDTVMSGFGSVGTTQASINYVGTQTVPGGFNFPQTTSFYGVTDTGGPNLPIRTSGTTGSGHRIEGATLLANAVVPAGPIENVTRYEGVSIGTFPKGGFWAIGGLTQLPEANKNKFRNNRFNRQTRALPVTTGAGGYYLDDWIVSFDGTVNFTLAVTAFTLGQTVVPFEPKFFATLTINSASGGTFLYFGQRVPGVQLFEGRSAVMSAWLSADTTRTINGQFQQVFGTGGSPSGTVGTATNSNSITTTMTRYAFAATNPSISGKTLGSNNNDNFFAGFSLPINTTQTFNIALPQLEAGPIPTAPLVRSDAEDEAMSAQFLQLIGCGATGSWSSATVPVLGQTFRFPMRAVPTISSTGVTVSIITPGDNTFTSASGVSLTSATKNGIVWTGNGFAGATALRNAICETDFVLASAEL